MNDLFAIIETWLSANNIAAQAELCPDGYTFVDHPRSGCRGGGAGFLHRDSLKTKKIGAGEKKSFEFSEWIVTGASHHLRIVVLYRPPYSREHPVVTNIFFCELSA